MNISKESKKYSLLHQTALGAGPAPPADTCTIMCLPTQIPPKQHFLYQPILWTQEVWKNISIYKGNVLEITRLFNLLPVIEAYMEDTIGLYLMRNLVHNNASILQDALVQVQTDVWDTDRCTQRPSVLQQLCTAADIQQHPITTNYYFPLQQDLDIDLPVFFSTMAENLNPANVSPTTDDDRRFEAEFIDTNVLEELIQEQHQRDRSISTQPVEDQLTQSQYVPNGNMYLHRIDFKRIFRTPEKRCETFKRFFIALKKVDQHSAIRPVHVHDATRIPVINTPTQVQDPELIDIEKYHKSWTPNQRYGLSGQILIESSFPFDELVILLQPWLHKAYYQVSLSECQSSELVNIGVLIRVSYTLYKPDLIATTKSVIAALPEESRFDFSFRSDYWFCSAGKVNVIFVAVARDRLKQGIDYFCNMYNGTNTKLPLAIKLVFMPLYQIQLTQEMRERIGQEQRAWQDNEVAIFVQGFQDLATIVTLKDETKCSLRSLLLRIPNQPMNSRKALFHGIDRRPESTEWIAMKYNRADADIFKKRAPGLAYELAQMVVESDVEKIFINPTVGLNFGGEWRHSFSANTKSGRRMNPTPADPALLTHFHSVLDKLQPAAIKRPAITPDPPRHPMPPNNTSLQSYATRAASATFTSTTINRNPSQAHIGNHHTRTESVLVIEQYEARFVHVESRLDSVERTVNRSGDMLARLLRHNGINVDEDVGMDPTAGTMEIEPQTLPESGTKRVCPSSPSESSQRASSSQNHD